MELKEKIFKKQNLLILIIIAFAIIIRIIGWPNRIDALNCDEAMMAINAKSIAQTGNDMYGTRLPVYFEAWLLAGQSAMPTYLVSLFIKVLGFNMFAIRLPILIVSIISIFITYLLTKEIFGEKTGIIALFLISICPWHILQSQWNLDCNLFPHIILIASYLLVKGILRNKNPYIYLSMIFFGLSMYCYGIALYFVPLFLLILGIYCLIKKHITIQLMINAGILYVIISLPIFIMTFINIFKLSSTQVMGFTIQRFYYNTRSNDMLIFSKDIINQFKLNISSLFKTVIIQNDELEWNSIKGFGTIYLFSIMFEILGILFLIKEKKETKLNKIILIWIAISLIIGILINKININRLNIIWYPLLIVTSYGIYKFITWKKHFIFKFIIIGIYIITFIMFYYKLNYKYKYKIAQSKVFSKGLTTALEYIKNNENKLVCVSANANTRAQYIYYKFLFNNFDIPTKREEPIYYYENNNENMTWFNTDNIEFKTVKIDINTNFNEKVYLIKKEELKNIKNINQYKTDEFGDYIVLERKE